MTRLRTLAAFVVVGMTTGLIWTGVAARGPWSLCGRDGARHGCNRRHRRRMDRRLGHGPAVLRRRGPRSHARPDRTRARRDHRRDLGPDVDAGGGVWAGMSGSPVYIDHGGGPELAGALAYGFSFGATNIAGLTPAEDMLHVNGLSVSSRAASRVPARIKLPRSVVRKVAAKIGAALPTVGGSLVRLKLPMSISGVAPERYAGDAEAPLPEEVPADDEVHARRGCALRQPLRSRGRPRPRRELRRRPLLRRPHLGGRRERRPTSATGRRSLSDTRCSSPGGRRSAPARRTRSRSCPTRSAPTSSPTSRAPSARSTRTASRASARWTVSPRRSRSRPRSRQLDSDNIARRRNGRRLHGGVSRLRLLPHLLQHRLRVRQDRCRARRPTAGRSKASARTGPRGSSTRRTCYVSEFDLSFESAFEIYGELLAIANYPNEDIELTNTEATINLEETVRDYHIERLLWCHGGTCEKVRSLQRLPG